MRYSALATAAFAATALAGPVEKRDYVTEVTYVTVTVYVTPGQEPTPYPAHKETPVYHAPAPKYTPVYTPVYHPKPAKHSSKAPYVAPKPSKAASAPVSSSGSPPPTSDYEGTCLYHHNVHRANHSAPALSWDSGLASAAYSWASQCQFKHHVDGYGQNLAASAPNANVSAQISQGWYGEYKNYAPYYGQASPRWSESTFEGLGHFSQLVWKNTQKVGCATYDCRGSKLGMWYTVCNYHPAGNYAGEYAANVGRPLGQAPCKYSN